MPQLTVGKLLHHIKHRLAIGDITLDYGVSLCIENSAIMDQAVCTATVERLNASGEVYKTDFLLCNYVPRTSDPLTFPEYDKEQLEKELQTWLNSKTNN